jgi:hypothetical protein
LIPLITLLLIATLAVWTVYQTALIAEEIRTMKEAIARLQAAATAFIAASADNADPANVTAVDAVTKQLTDATAALTSPLPVPTT